MSSPVRVNSKSLVMAEVNRSHGMVKHQQRRLALSGFGEAHSISLLFLDLIMKIYVSYTDRKFIRISNAFQSKLIDIYIYNLKKAKTKL